MTAQNIEDTPEDSGEFTLAFTDEEIAHIAKYGRERSRLNSPSILIVEDQDFSRKLLADMLGHKFVCYSATNVREALALYAEHVPCIVFLDVELPDMNGHELAAFIKKYDPQSYIVMVTANNYMKDVMQAQQNNVQGFITKPYSKQKIMEAIHKYSARMSKPRLRATTHKGKHG